MKTTSSLGAALLGVLLLAGCQNPSPRASTPSGNVVVEFQNMDRFSDFDDGPTGRHDAAEDHAEIVRRAVTDTAQRYLAPGQTLRITFTDIDLAGDHLPSMRFGPDPVRVIKDIYPPRAKLTFALTDASGAVVKQGDRTLSDRGFELRLNPIGDDLLEYDLRMLRDWLRSELRDTRVAVLRS